MPNWYDSENHHIIRHRQRLHLADVCQALFLRKGYPKKARTAYGKKEMRISFYPNFPLNPARALTRSGHNVLYTAGMTQDEFEKIVAEGYERLPEWVRKKISNVAVLIEDEASEEDRKEEGLADDETLLGLYKGIPLAARGEFYGVGMTMPDTITLYRLPILEAAEEENKSVADVVAETIWHEFAHHFGMDEHEVRQRERDGNK